jgi:hypothetical protein
VNLLGAALVLPLCGCISGTLAQESRHQPLTDEALDRLVPGSATLEDCLSALGAPLQVEENGEQTVLSWGWRDVRGFRVAVSVPIGDNSARLTWAEEAKEMKGVVAILGSDQVLILLRRGQLGEILPGKRRASQLISDD